MPNYIKIKRGNLKVFLILRFFFLFSFPILIRIERDYIKENDYYFSFIVLIQMALLGISNGFVACYCFIFCGSEVPSNLIGKSGGCVSFFLNLGISIGGLYSFTITENFLV